MICLYIISVYIKNKQDKVFAFLVFLYLKINDNLKNVKSVKLTETRKWKNIRKETDNKTLLYYYKIRKYK